MGLDRTTQGECGTSDERRKGAELCALPLLFNKAIEVRTTYAVPPDTDLHRLKRFRAYPLSYSANVNFHDLCHLFGGKHFLFLHTKDSSFHFSHYSGGALLRQ